MVESTHVKQHLDEFNSIIINLGLINIKIESLDHGLIVLCFLLVSYKTFMDKLLYGKETISVNNVSSMLKFKGAKKEFSNGKDVSDGKGLVARGRSQQMDNRSKSKSMSKGKKVHVLSVMSREIIGETI